MASEAPSHLDLADSDFQRTSGPDNPEPSAVPESPVEAPSSAVVELGGPPETAADPNPEVCPQCAGVKSVAARRCARCARGESPGRSTEARQVAPSYTGRGTNAFRVYCVMCGRSSEVPAAASRLGRCPVCGGTQLNEDLT